MTTRAIVLNREQIENLARQFEGAVNDPEVLSIYFVTTDDEDVKRWFLEEMVGDQPQLNIEFDEMFLGDVYTLFLDYEVTPDVLTEMGMEQ